MKVMLSKSVDALRSCDKNVPVEEVSVQAYLLQLLEGKVDRVVVTLIIDVDDA